MRLTTLLDSVNQGGSGPWPIATDAGTTPLTADVNRTLDDLVADLIPCRSHDPELWFAERTADVERAKAMCHDCPIMEGCLAGAIERAEPWGVWGGQVFIDGVVVPMKRGRGRPRKNPLPVA